jgi:hypothetical protein
MQLRKPKLTREMIRQSILEAERLGLIRFPKNHPKYQEHEVRRKAQG